LSRTPVVNDLPIVCSGGFSAIWLDRAAYEQTEAVAVEAALTSALAASPIVGVSDRYALFDLRTYCAQFHATVGPDTAARLSDEVLRPVYALWQHGARLITVLRASRGERVVRVPGELSLFNAGDSGRQVTVSFTLTSVDPTGSTLGITWPDGSDQTVSLDEAVTKTLVLGAGPNLVEFHAAVDPALVEFVLTDLYAVDPDLLASPAS
jgi:hypothetical protein